MVKQLSNIGQLLTLVSHKSQAVGGRGQSVKSNRFSIGENDGLQKKNSSDIKTNDNADKCEQKKADTNFVCKKNNADNKKAGDEPDKQIKNCGNKKKEISNSQKPEDDSAIGGTDSAIDNHPDKVTGQEDQSEKVAVLQETVNEQPRINVIGQEKTNLEKMLKENSASISEKQAIDIPSEKQSISKDLIQSESDESRQKTSEIINNKTNNNIPDKTSNANSDNTISEQKNSPAEQVSDFKNERINAGINNSKPGVINNQNENVIETQNKRVLPVQNKNVIQTQEIPKSDTQESSDTKQKLNNEKADSNLNLLETAQGGKALFNKAADNTKDAVITRPEIADAAVNDIKVKDKNESVTDNGKTDIEQILSNADTSQADKSSSVSAAKANPDLMRANPQDDISAQISRQITESIHSSMAREGNERQITVRLNPPELGSVVVKFSEQGNQLTGVLEVSKPQTRFEIEHALPHIIRTLAESGIQLKKIDVVSSADTNHANNDSMNERMPWNNNSDQSSHSGSFNQQAGQGDFNNAGFRQWFSNSISYNQGYRHEPAFASGGSINVLA